MTLTLDHVVFLGAAVNLWTSYYYIRSTLRGDTQPNRATWFLWAIAPLTAAAAMIIEGGGFAAVSVFISGFVPLLIFLASFVNPASYWQLTRFDYLCGVLSMAALLVWAATRSGVYAVCIALLADALALLPTAVKAYRFPHTEHSTAFFGGAVSASTGIFVALNGSALDLVFPLYLLAACILMIVLIERPRLLHWAKKTLN